MKLILRVWFIVVPVLLSGCMQHTLTSDEVSQIRSTSRGIQNADRVERREYLQDRKEFELNYEGDNIYIAR